MLRTDGRIPRYEVRDLATSNVVQMEPSVCVWADDASPTVCTLVGLEASTDYVFSVRAVTNATQAVQSSSVSGLCPFLTALI